MELLKVILNFISSIAYPLVAGILLVLCRDQIRTILEMLGRFLFKVNERFEAGEMEITLWNVKLGPLAKSAAETIEDLLSPAVPLALGYFDNFLKGLVVQGDGCFEFLLNDQSGQYQIHKVFSIYVPRELPKEVASWRSLVEWAYRDQHIKNISIQSRYGRPFTAFAISRATVLYPIDVPKTLTSIQQVFEYRAKELLKGKLDAAKVRELESKYLDTFAEIIGHETEHLRISKCIRIIREASELFSSGSSEV